ncbi:vesicular [Triplophysa rosa]|uniref:WW domain binding protein VOPP1 n=1 Tax=Triplophysa rosa TaxID=992332 RepID=A0A9W7WVJ1_TRIRA|nr:vesicular [Triplophysa rosa]
MRQLRCILLTVCLIAETVAEKKYCWYFEGGYPVYFICKTYEDCCDTQCCVRVLSIQRTWYFGLLLVIAIVCCCGAGYFIRRRVHTYTLPDGPDFNVTFTRHPILSPGEPISHYSTFPARTTFNGHMSLDALGVSLMAPCADRTATGRLSELRGCRDHSHFNCLPSADSPRTSDNCIPSPPTPLQPTSSFL